MGKVLLTMLWVNQGHARTGPVWDWVGVALARIGPGVPVVPRTNPVRDQARNVIWVGVSRCHPSNGIHFLGEHHPPCPGTVSHCVKWQLWCQSCSGAPYQSRTGSGLERYLGLSRCHPSSGIHFPGEHRPPCPGTVSHCVKWQLLLSCQCSYTQNLSSSELLPKLLIQSRFCTRKRYDKTKYV